MTNRLYEIRELAGLSQARLAEKVKSSQPQIAKLEKQPSEADYRKMTAEWAKRLSPHLKLDWSIILAAAVGEMDEEPLKGPRKKLVLPSFDPEKEDGTDGGGVSSVTPYEGKLQNAIPDLEVAGGMGSGQISRVVTAADRNGVAYSADAVRGEIVLPPYLLAEYTRTSPAFVHSVRVRGDSMEATLSSGDRVFVDTADTAIGQGGIFVILDHRYDEVLVKRLRRIGAGESMRIEIISDNPLQGNDKVLPDEINVIGRAIARLTRL